MLSSLSDSDLDVVLQTNFGAIMHDALYCCRECSLDDLCGVMPDGVQSTRSGRDAG
jgi:hypothetical protein